MRTTSIAALRPNVTKEDAVREFSSRGLSSMYWRLTAGRLQRIAEAYVPYQFYEVSYVMGRAPQTRLFAMDAVDGSLDLFEFPQLPSRQQLVTTDTRNRLEPSLSAGAADELLREKALRVVFQQGFFKVREASLDTLIIANGFSCREQIEQTTNRKALHLSQVLQMALHDGSGGPLRSE